VKVKAIQYRISQLRQEGAALGLSSSKAASSAPKTSIRTSAAAKNGNAKARKRGGILSANVR